MSWPGVAALDAGLIVLYLAVLWLPGALVCAVAGLRGWVLAAAAPLMTYGVAGLAGPWYSAVGVRWSFGTFGLAVAGCAALLGAGRLLLLRRGAAAPSAEDAEDPASNAGWRPAGWRRWEHLAVAGAVLAAGLIGAVSILGGIRRLTTIPQDWDAAFHANGIRWIANTGDGGLYAMSQVNWFEGGVQVYYPNAYHLVAATVVELTGRDVPSVLNAQTVLIPALLALTTAALVRRFGGRAMFAGAAAVLVATVSAVYDLLWRGPLLPFAVGVALTPVIVILIAELLDARGWRQAAPIAVLVALGTAGLAGLQPAMLFGAVLFTLPMLAQRWLQRPSRLRTEPLVLLAVAVAAAAPLFLQFAGALDSAKVTGTDWPAAYRYPIALLETVTFAHGPPVGPQWLLAGALVVGVLRYRRLRNLQWIGPAALAFTVLFVAAASLEAPWAHALTRPWWNDRWRLIALAAVPLAIVAAHGVAELQQLLTRLLQLIGSRLIGSRRPAWATAASALATVILVAVVVLSSDGLYIGRNQERMAMNTDEGIAISGREVAAMQVLARLAPPGSKVLNDRGDGSVWMYALAGVRPVAGHYDGTLTGADAAILAQRFNRFETDPDVRGAVDRLNVRYVLLGTGFLRGDMTRQPGLTDLGSQPWLELVYDNGAAVIYRIRDVPDRTARSPATTQIGGPG